MQRRAKLLALSTLALSLATVGSLLCSTASSTPQLAATIYLPLVVQGPNMYLVSIEDLAQADQIVTALQEIRVTIVRRFEHVQVIIICLPPIDKPFGQWEIIERIKQIPGVVDVELDAYIIPELP